MVEMFRYMPRSIPQSRSSHSRVTIILCLLYVSISYCYAFNKNPSRLSLSPHSRILTQLNALVPIKQITDNKKSSFEYEFTETYEAGLMLTGTEVKSCRKGMVQLSDSMAEIIDGEAWLLNCHIGNFFSLLSRCQL